MAHTFRFVPFSEEDGRASLARQKERGIGYALEVFEERDTHSRLWPSHDYQFCPACDGLEADDCDQCGVEPPNHDASCSRFDSAAYTDE